MLPASVPHGLLVRPVHASYERQYHHLCLVISPVCSRPVNANIPCHTFFQWCCRPIGRRLRHDPPAPIGAGGSTPAAGRSSGGMICACDRRHVAAATGRRLWCRQRTARFRLAGDMGRPAYWPGGCGDCYRRHGVWCRLLPARHLVPGGLVPPVGGTVYGAGRPPGTKSGGRAAGPCRGLAGAPRGRPLEPVRRSAGRSPPGNRRAARCPAEFRRASCGAGRAIRMASRDVVLWGRASSQCRHGSCSGGHGMWCRLLAARHAAAESDGDYASRLLAARSEGRRVVPCGGPCEGALRDILRTCSFWPHDMPPPCIWHASTTNQSRRRTQPSRQV